MQRYYISAEQVDPANGSVRVTGEELHHMLKVMRFRSGNRFWCFDPHGVEYLVELERVTGEEGVGRILLKQRNEREPLHRVTLAQALSKGDKMDWIVQKNTEIGVHSFLPFAAERSIVHLTPEKERKRQERWQRIAKEAAEQAQRGHVPVVRPLLTWRELLKCSDGYDMVLLAYEGEVPPLKSVLEERVDFRTLLLIVGPEGGFTEREVQEAQEKGILPISLGKRILRTETAGLAALASLFYHFDE